MLENQKANSYSQPALPVNTETAPKHAGSEKSSTPRVQHGFLPLNTKQTPRNGDNWTAVSNWLAAAQTFEKPPPPESIADPARHSKEYWLQISDCLDLAIKSRSEQSKAPTHLNTSRMNANLDIDSRVSNPQSQDKRTPPGRINTNTDTVFPLSPNTMGPAGKHERERKDSIEACISEVREKLEKHKREREKQEQLEAEGLTKADEAAKATAKQLEAAKSQKADEAIKAKAKKLAADAMATHKKDQERRKYVEGRAWDIHGNLLQCKPFDIDAVRREFSEKEVQDIKKLVRELDLVKNR